MGWSGRLLFVNPEDQFSHVAQLYSGPGKKKYF